MVTYKVLLDKRRSKSDGTYPIVIRVTSDRRSTTINAGVFIRAEHWHEQQSCVKPIHSNANLLNKKITEGYLKIQKAVLQLDDDFTFESLRELLEGNNQPIKPKQHLSFNEYAAQLISDMVAINKAGNAIIYQTAIRRLMNYSGKTAVKFTDITYTFLDGFRSQLIKDNVKQNTISNYFRTIRAIYNKAIKAKLVDRSHYPFLDIPIKTERTAKRAITATDIRKIYNAKYKPGTPKWHARNYFLLSFALRGISFTDLAYLNYSNLYKGRLIYKRRKTHSQLNIKLHPVAEEILSLYQGNQTKYLLPTLPEDIVEDSLRAKNLLMQWIKTTNKWLKRIAVECSIDAEITTYVTRHSWATIAKRIGYSIELIAECLGHQYGNKITNIYLDNFDINVIDEANDNVLLSAFPCRMEYRHSYQFVLKHIPKQTNIPVSLLAS